MEAANQGPVDGARIGVLGASFKAGTSDVRSSPALRLAGLLHQDGAQVRIYDPESVEAARRLHPEYTYANSAAEAVTDSDVVVIGTEWPQFTQDADLPTQLAAVVARHVVVDVRNALDVPTWQAAGWQVRQMGRPTQHPTT